MFVANSAQIREMDQQMSEQFSYPSLLLMETAGRLAAERIAELYPQIQHFLVVCGTGNNGGDGLVVARYLHRMGRQPRVLLVGDLNAVAGDAALQLAIVRKSELPFELYAPELKASLDTYLQQGTLIVDALLGTGSSGPLREPIKSVVQWLATTPNSVIALDMPSGLDGNSGVVQTRPMRCAHTLTFQLPKFCHYLTPAANFCGEIHILDIGIYPRVVERAGIKAQLLTDKLIRYWHRSRKADDHKGIFGHVLLAGGSRGKAGAIALATQSALEIGAGLSTAFIPGSAACAFHRTSLENMSIPYGTEQSFSLNGTAGDLFGTYLSDKNTVAIGPGLDNNKDTAAFLAEALPQIVQPLVLDADALNLLAEHPDLWDKLPARTILTPHPGEMARLLKTETGTVQNDRLAAALELATTRKVTVVLKGAGTLIADPSGQLYICAAGNPGMATGGSGDVLTGAIAGLLAQGYPPLQATAMAVYIHARTGDLVAAEHGMEGVVAGKLMRNLGKGLRMILQEEASVTNPV